MNRRIWRAIVLAMKGNAVRSRPSVRPLLGLVIAASFYALVGRVAAQEYCVACTEPTAVYRCVIDGARPGGNQPLQMLCLTAMAKEGQHGTCSVKSGTVFDCNGPVKRVPWAAAQELAPQPKTATSPPADTSQPPQTVQEMAKRANDKTVEQIKKTNDNLKQGAQSLGDKVGDATKKTWRCISSLFTRCLE
jgi:hypothetical protein